MSYVAKILADKSGRIRGAMVFPCPGPGHVLLNITSYSVLRVVEASTSHPTNGSRGRIYRFLEHEQAQAAFTELLLRAMAAPMDESVLFAPIADDLEPWSAAH